MRSFPAILLAALTVVVITVSVVLTASHFGMRDWPTPPMPDSATRLITPTEAAAKARERLSKGDDPAEVTIAGEAGSDAHRSERTDAGRSTSRATTGSRRSPSRRGARTGRSSAEHRSGQRGHGNIGSDDQTQEPSGDDLAAPAPAQPSTPQATPSAPVTQAAAGEQSQARSDDPVIPPATQPAVPAPLLPPVVSPVVPPLPTAPAPSSGDDSPGRGNGRRRGPVRNLLDHLL